MTFFGLYYNETFENAMYSQRTKYNNLKSTKKSAENQQQAETLKPTDMTSA